MDEKPDLRGVYKLYSTMMGLAFAAVAGGLWYANSKDADVQIDQPPEISIPAEEGVSPQP